MRRHSADSCASSGCGTRAASSFKERRLPARTAGPTRSSNLATYERGLSKQQIIDIYRFIDWVLTLPESLELKYTDAVFQIEEDLKMPYMSFIERRGHAAGRAAGQAAGQVTGAGMIVREQLEERFGPLPATALARLEAADAEQPRAWARRLLDAGSLDDVLGDPD